MCLNEKKGHVNVFLAKSVAKSTFKYCFRYDLNGIRVKTKDELVQRIYRYFEEVNEEPIVYHWKYKLEELGPNEKVQVETLPTKKSS